MFGVPKVRLGVLKPRLGDPKPRLGDPKPDHGVPKRRLGAPKPRLVDEELVLCTATKLNVCQWIIAQRISRSAETQFIQLKAF